MLESVTLSNVSDTTELRLLGKSSDGVNVNLVDHEGNEYSLRISDTLRATVNQPRLSAVEVEETQPITIKELQARLRAGESVESLARAAQWSVDKVERFASPIFQERSYIIGLAHDVVIRREAGRDPVTFLDVVTTRLSPRQVDMTEIEWDCWRLEDSSWIIRLGYPTREGQSLADWSFDSTRRALTALDESSQWILGEDSNARGRNSQDHGMIYGNHPAGKSIDTSPFSPISSISQKQNEGFDPPRLVSIQDLPDDDEERDGVTTRARVPSWDEIMFGGKRPEEEPEI
ncbi:MAG: septation protein SepH [Actinomycetota bacterium]